MTVHVELHVTYSSNFRALHQFRSGWKKIQTSRSWSTCYSISSKKTLVTRLEQRKTNQVTGADPQAPVLAAGPAAHSPRTSPGGRSGRALSPLDLTSPVGANHGLDQERKARADPARDCPVSLPVRLVSMIIRPTQTILMKPSLSVIPGRIHHTFISSEPLLQGTTASSKEEDGQEEGLQHQENVNIHQQRGRGWGED